MIWKLLAAVAALVAFVATSLLMAEVERNNARMTYQ